MVGHRRVAAKFIYEYTYSFIGESMPYKDPKDRREQSSRWAKANRAKKREWNKRLRIRVIKLLGGKCVNCGCDDFEALEINHINGGGSQEKNKKYGGSYRSFLYDILAGRRSKDDLDIRCKVCNAAHCLKELKKLNGNWKIIYEKDGASRNRTSPTTVQA